MKTITRDYVAIPKVTWIKIQNKLKEEYLSEEEKVELWFVSLDDLSEVQKNNLSEAKKLKKLEFVNL